MDRGRPHGDPIPVVDSAADGPDSQLPGLYDPAERVRAQWSDSVDGEILYPSPGLWDAIKRSTIASSRSRASRRTTTGSPSSVHKPDRLFGLAKLPSTSVEDAQDELLRGT